MYRNDLNGKKITLSLLEVRVIEGSSYQGLGLVNVSVNVRRKSRGNRRRFELARVRVIESQLYMFGYRKYHGCPTALLSFTDRTMGERSRQTQYHWHDSH